MWVYKFDFATMFLVIRSAFSSSVHYEADKGLDNIRAINPYKTIENGSAMNLWMRLN